MLDPKKFGLAGGILWGLCMFACTVLAIFTGYAEMFIKIMEGIYPGYSISWEGSIIGLVYGFFDAFIGLFIFAWLYNKLTANK
jgi:hypothetical protein